MFSSLIMGQQAMSWFIIPLLQRLACGEAGASKLTVSASWKILHCFSCGALGMFLVVLATTNPSLALVLALPLVPIFILVRPARSVLSFVFQALVLFCLSPPMLLFLYAFSKSSIAAATSFADAAFHHWDLYGALLLPVICVFYWPLNLAAQLIISMEP